MKILFSYYSRNELRRTITICSALILVISLAEQTVGRAPQADSVTQLDAAFAAVDRATTVADLLKEASTASYNTPAVREGLWYVAAYVTLQRDYADGDVVIKKVIKTVVFATLLELAARGELSKWPKDEQLFAIGPQSLASISKYLSFAREGDPISSWLKRSPSINESMVEGDYQYMHFNIYGKGIYLLLERADVPLLGLSPEWKMSQGKLDTQANDKSVPLEGLTYNFPLRSTRYIIAIAKAYLCLSLLPSNSPLEKYALLMVGNSFLVLSRASGSDESNQLAGTASDVLRRAVEEFGEQPPAGGRALSAETLQPRLTMSRFFARKFSVALEDYKAAAKAPNRPADFHIYGEWGAAMCLLGMGDKTMAAEHLRRVAILLQRETPALDRSPFRYMMVALIDAMGVRSILGGEPYTDSLKAAIESWRNTEFSEATRYELNLDLFRVLNTIGNYDAEAKISMREIARVHSLSEPEFRAVESQYLIELAATLGDIFSALSWALDEDGSAQPRLKDMREWSHQFVPTKMDKYMAGCHGTNRYGACSPEEDRATAVEFYVPDSIMPYESGFNQVLKLTESSVLGPRDVAIDAKPDALPESTPAAAKDFTQWVEQEHRRKPPNVVPLLKLTWIEWFNLPLSGLKTPGSLFSWRYRPLNKSGLTSIKEIEARLKDAGQNADPQTRRIWELFKDAHEFLLTY